MTVEEERGDTEDVQESLDEVQTKVYEVLGRVIKRSQ